MMRVLDEEAWSLFYMLVTNDSSAEEEEGVPEEEMAALGQPAVWPRSPGWGGCLRKDTGLPFQQLLALGLPESRAVLWEPPVGFCAVTSSDPYLSLGVLPSSVVSWKEKKKRHLAERSYFYVVFFWTWLNLCRVWQWTNASHSFFCSSQDFIDLCWLFSWLRSAGMFRSFPYGRHFMVLVTLTAGWLIFPETPFST